MKNLEVICGPMFAGKTEELLRRTRRLEYAKKKYLLFKPSIDKRYSVDNVVSHNKTSMKAINIDINNPLEIYNYLEDDIKIIIIDEIQFFNKSILNILKELIKKDYKIICAGLDLDFKGEPFGIMGDVLALADDIMKLTAICMKCGKEATRTQRLINNEPASVNDPIILVGAIESYEARCKDCHELKD